MYTPNYHNSHMIHTYGFAVTQNYAEKLNFPMDHKLEEMSKYKIMLCKLIGCINKKNQDNSDVFDMNTKDAKIVYSFNITEGYNINLIRHLRIIFLTDEMAKSKAAF